MSLSPIFRDCLVRYQQTAIRETGHRPVTFLRTPENSTLLLPGCQKPGYSFWQPVPWKDNRAPIGDESVSFHQSIVEYVSFCQFLEIRFCLPVAHAGSPLSFLYRRVFETCPNTELSPPSRAFEEAHAAQRGQLPLAFCMAVTCDEGEPLMLMLQASDGQAFVARPMREDEPLYLKLGLDRLLPKLQFIYDPD